MEHTTAQETMHKLTCTGKDECDLACKKLASVAGLPGTYLAGTWVRKALWLAIAVSQLLRLLLVLDMHALTQPLHQRSACIDSSTSTNVLSALATRLGVQHSAR